MYLNNGFVRWSPAVVLAVTLAGCGGETPGDAPVAAGAAAGDGGVSVIEGEVFYRERIMLPPGAELEVQLEDISRADAMATVITTVTYTLDGAPPYPFSIEYDPSRIDPRMRYALRARITDDGELRFTNTEYINPFSGAPVRILVTAVARPQEAPLGDAPETGHGDKPAAGSEAVSDAAIVWILATLEGEDAPLGIRGKPVDMQLDESTQQVSGFSGCNRYMGGFSSDGASVHGTPIKFGPLAGTMMACPEGEDVERRYLAVLGRVDAYRMDGDSLFLLAGDKVVATYRIR